MSCWRACEPCSGARAGARPPRSRRATSGSTRASTGAGAGRPRCRSRLASSPCSSSCCAGRDSSSRRPSSSTASGSTTSTAIPTSSRCTSGACAARSTSPSTAAPSRPCVARGIAWCPMADERPRRPSPWRTVRFRLTALATLVVALVLVLTAWAVVHVQRTTLHNIAEETLEQRADGIEADLQRGVILTQLPRGTDDDSLSQLVDADGNVVGTSTNLDPSAPRLGPALDNGAHQAFSEISGRPIDPAAPFLMLTRRVETSGGDSFLYVADNLDDVRESVDTLENTLRVVIPLVTVGLAGLLWWLTGRMLRPVEAIRREVASIDGTDLQRRVPVPPTEDEIGRLAQTMNAMLDRVEEANDRQRRFVADASHELRSPLTRIRSEIEVDLAHPESADAEATERSVLAEAVEIGRAHV